MPPRSRKPDDSEPGHNCINFERKTTNGYVRRFAMDWIENHVEAVPLNMRHEEASRLASKLLTVVAGEGLDRDDIEEALGADLEFYMFQAATTATVQGDAGLKAATASTERRPPGRLGPRGKLHSVWLN